MAEIRRLGFVQLDSISIVERAHHHILWTRLPGYGPAMLAELQSQGRIFEHWTHDASVIPSEWFPHWRRRFAHIAWGSWLRRRVGRDHRRVTDHVIDRIRNEGPLLARDFEHRGRKGGAWWDWKPAKAALEYWWRQGELSIPRRERFEKVYDLTERVLKEHHAAPTPSIEMRTGWACRGALDRLGVATPRELAQFWNLTTISQAAAWCAAAVKRGDAVPVRVEGAKSLSYALPDWEVRVKNAPPPPRGLRILSPFDPVIRDRARCQRLFDFDYRFEAFVPAAKRRHGYYVLPILDGHRFVGRLDPKLDRRGGVLQISHIWWEPRAGTRSRTRALEDSLARYAKFSGVGRVEVAKQRHS